MNTLEASTEISVAVNFMLSHLYNKLPRRRVDAFAEEVEKGILSKFQGHWYPEKPSKGAAYRCIAVSSEKIDPVILHAARHSGLDVDEVKSCLPEELLLWIDPGEVSYAVGDRGGVKVLYSEYAAAAAASLRPHSSSPCGAQPPPPQPTKQQTAAMEQSALQPLHGCLPAVTGVASDPFSVCDASSALSSSLESLSLSPLPVGGVASSPWGSADPWCHPLGLSPWPSSPAATSTLVGGSGSLHHHHQQPPPHVLPPSLQQQQPPPPLSPHPSQLPSAALQFGAGVAGRSSGCVVGAIGGVAAGGPPGGANKTFTAAMFAQTKFGSTKLKSKSKNPSRLSPSVDATAAAAVFAAAAISPMPPAAAATVSSSYLSASNQHQTASLHHPSMSAAAAAGSATSHLLPPPQQRPRAAATSAASMYFDSFFDLPFLSALPQPQLQQLPPSPTLQHGSGVSATGLGPLMGLARDMEPTAAAIATVMVEDASLIALSPAVAADASRAHAWLDLRGGGSGGSPVAYSGPFRHVAVA